MKEKELYTEILKQHLTLPTELSADDIVRTEEKKIRKKTYVRTSFVRYAVAAAAVALAIGVGIKVLHSSDNIKTETAEDIIPNMTVMSEQDPSQAITESSVPAEDAIGIFTTVFNLAAEQKNDLEVSIVNYVESDDSLLDFDGRKVLDTISVSQDAESDFISSIIQYMIAQKPEYLGCRAVGKEGKGDLAESDLQKIFGVQTSTLVFSYRNAQYDAVDFAALTVIDNDVYVCLFDSQLLDLGTDQEYEYYFKIPASDDNDFAAIVQHLQERVISKEEWEQIISTVSPEEAKSKPLAEFKDQEFTSTFSLSGNPTIKYRIDMSTGTPTVTVESISLDTDEKITSINIGIRAYFKREGERDLISEINTPNLGCPITLMNYEDENGGTLKGVRLTVSFNTDKHSIENMHDYNDRAYVCLIEVGEVYDID